ncbi:MAG: SGNH/GDSL hydrolase family protein [Oscillospiraceae bacterium]|nr:SGNH/GDSL hydrolase family protein [Oscillospiraceae bacterium]
MMKKNILCFGDSNTWGYTPGSGVRYSPEVRWPGVMAAELGESYRVLEDGLSGRTTAYDFPWADCRNGMTALPYALFSQKPLDLLILALGINDLTVVDSALSARSAGGLIRKVRLLQAVPDSAGPIFAGDIRILVLAPAPVHPDYDRMYGTSYYQESCRLAARYKTMAEENGVFYLNGGDYASASPVDCVHFPQEAHRRLGLAAAGKVREIFG